MKDRFQNIGRAATLSAGIGTAFLVGGCATQDTSYRDRAWGIDVPTDDGTARCYSDERPEIRITDRNVNADGNEIISWTLTQTNFACDNAGVLEMGYRDGEQVDYLAIGSQLPQEPVLERLK